MPRFTISRVILKTSENFEMKYSVSHEKKNCVLDVAVVDAAWWSWQKDAHLTISGVLS